MTLYYLAASFGGVPIEIDTSGMANLGLRPRSPRDSVFMQVVSDMQQAATLLLSKKDLAKADLGRATKGAAYAYLGAAHMWLKNILPTCMNTITRTMMSRSLKFSLQ
jgi:starch-binding outer membrane protein, SusD/RagB family